MSLRINKIGLSDINELQSRIVLVIDGWVRTNKTPVPKKYLIKEMKNNGVKEVTTKAAINVLLRRGYIRKAVTLTTQVSYVQLRTIAH